LLSQTEFQMRFIMKGHPVVDLKNNVFENKNCKLIPSIHLFASESFTHLFFHEMNLFIYLFINSLTDAHTLTHWHTHSHLFAHSFIYSFTFRPVHSLPIIHCRLPFIVIQMCRLVRFNVDLQLLINQITQ